MKRMIRADLAPVALGASLLGLLALTSPVFAQQDSFSQQMQDIRNAFGLGSPRAPIDFSERPPLVVPPSTNLPPPGTGDASLGVHDPDVIARHKALTESRRPVPPSDPGANAQGLSARTYLIDPPSGMRDPRAVAADITTDKGTAPADKPTRKRRNKPVSVQAEQ